MGVKACSEELHFDNSSDVLTQVANLVSVGVPTMTRATNDGTNQNSGCIEQLSPALLQLGPIPFTVEYVPGDADDLLLTEMMTSGSTRNYEIRIDDGTGTGGQMAVTGEGFLVEYAPGGGEAAPGGERRSTGSFQSTNVFTVAAVP